MANKSFVVEYLIKARERYVAVAQKIARVTKLMRDRVKQASKSFDEFSAKARRAGAKMTAGLTLPIGFLLNSMKNAARDAGETESKFVEVFKGVEGSANAISKNLAKNYGLASDQSKELLSNTGDLLVGLNFNRESALKLSEQVTKLSVDLVSFKNFSGGATGASAALTKALLGERESLKSLGIAISEKDVKQKIAQLAAKGQRFATEKQAKAQATLILAMEQSKNAIGDFARTQEQLAGQERILGAETRDLKVAFGKILIPVMLAIVKVVRSVVQWFNELSPTTKKVILIVAGIIAVLGPLLLAFGSIILILPALSAGFTMLGAAVTIATGPIGLMIMALIAGAALIINKWEAVSEFFEGIGAKIANIIDAVTKFDFGSFGLDTIKAKLFGSESAAAMPASRVDVGVNVGLDRGLTQTAKPAILGQNIRRTDVGLATSG